MSRPFSSRDIEVGEEQSRQNDEIGSDLRRLPSSTHYASTEIQARRNGSASILLRNEKGELVVERKSSDLLIALKSRMSASSLPTIVPLREAAPVAPVIDATDVLERTGGTSSTGTYKEHLYSLEVLAEKLSTDIDANDVSKSRGLSTLKAAELLAEFGPNVLTPPPRLPLWALFLMQFTNLLMVLLQVTALLCIILFIVNPSVWDNLYLGLLLYIAIILTCYETFSQEAKSDSLMEQFRAMVPEQASVIRDGQLKPVPACDLVIGDIVRLKVGEKVPADCRVLSVSSMKVDQSMITGESEPVDIEVHAVDTNALEARNLIFNGSLIVDGSCFAIVVKTGDATLIGTMVGLTGDVGKASSTLKADIEHFVKIVTLFALMQAALIFIVGLSRGYDPLTVFIYGFVVIMIGNVPQGLPTTVTASLYLVAERMSHQNVFVKKLDIIETLGACTLICTDKTGTLTMNQMTVSHLWLPAMDGVSFTAESFAQHLLTNPSIVASSTSTAMQLLSIGSLNSRVELEERQENATAAVKAGSTKDKTEDPNSTSNTEVSPTGDATELGLYRFFSNILRQLPQQGQPLRHEYDAIEQFRSKHPKVHEIPFNSSFKWQMSIHHLPQTKQHVLFLKGAPDVLLSKCRFYLTAENTIAPMEEAFQASYQQKYEEFGGQGERVLGFAMRYFDAASEGNYEDQCKKDSKFHEHLRERLIGKSNHSKVSAQLNTGPSTPVEPLNDLIFVGLITLMDPPRPEVPKAIQDCYSAHVKVIMVTGDHPLTAASIARQIGLLTKPTTKAEVAALRNIPEEDVTDEDIPAVVIHGQLIPKMTEEDWQRLTKKEEIVFARTSPEQKLTIVQEFTKAGHITAMTGDGVNDSPALKQAAIGIAMGLNGSAVAKEAADVVLLDDNFASIVTGIREGRLLFANLKKSIAYSLAHLTPEVIPVLMWGFAGVVQPMGSLLALCVDLLTELVPATSFVFEDPEDMIMQLPPRNPKTDKLTSWNLLFYAYGQAGMILTGGCLFYFFRAFQHYGVSPFQVMNNNNRFFPASSSDNIITIHKDGETHVYDEHDQKEILRVVQAGWYLMIVIGQVSHLYQCRTTRMSIFTHGLFRNSISNIGAVLAIVLGCFVVYCPGIRDIVSAAYPVSLEIFYASLLVSGAMWINGEGRKYILRTCPEHPVSKILAW